MYVCMDYFEVPNLNWAIYVQNGCQKCPNLRVLLKVSAEIKYLIYIWHGFCPESNAPINTYNMYVWVSVAHSANKKKIGDMAFSM